MPNKLGFRLEGHGPNEKRWRLMKTFRYNQSRLAFGVFDVAKREYPMNHYRLLSWPNNFLLETTEVKA